MPHKAVLVFNERGASELWRSALARDGSVDCELVELERLEGALERLKHERLDMILVDSDQSAERLIKAVVRAREGAPGVPVLVLPVGLNHSIAVDILRHAASQSAGANGRNGNPVALAMRCAENLHKGHLLNLALKDDLTGLYNRRGFLLIADEYRRTACRTRQNLFLFFADVDGLKQINDQFGHREGDRALVRAAESFERTFRGSDIVGRLGGDEFVALVIERRGRSAEAICRRLQENLAQCAGNEPRYHLSLSVGVARFDPTSAPSVQELVGQADEALYEQKRNKRASPLKNSPAEIARTPARSAFAGEKSGNGAGGQEAAIGY